MNPLRAAKGGPPTGATYHAAWRRLLAGRPLDESMDTERFAAWAERHGMAPLAHWLSVDADPSAAATFKPARVHATAAHLLRLAGIRELLAALGSAGIRPVLFKGLGVALQYYPSPDLRPLGDIDLLIEREQLSDAVEAAQRVGYRYLSDDALVREYYLTVGYNVPMGHPTWGLLELHHALYRDCDTAFVKALLQRTRTGQFETFDVRFFAPGDLFATLAVHWACSNPGLRWGWLLDLCLMARRMNASDWALVISNARRFHLELYVGLATETAYALWGCEPSVATARPEILGSLNRMERSVIGAALRALPPGMNIDSDCLRLARLIARGPVNGAPSPVRSVLTHPGAACQELGVLSTKPGFGLKKLEHAARRSMRLVRAAKGLSRLMLLPA